MKINKVLKILYLILVILVIAVSVVVLMKHKAPTENKTKGIIVTTTTPGLGDEVQSPSEINSIVLCEDSIYDFNEIEKILSNVVDKISSLVEFDIWLKSQSCVKSVKMIKGIIETLPPRKEFIVEFKMKDGSISKKAIDITLLEEQKFRFHKLHD